LYERIQGYIFRLMATDSVPRVCPLPSSSREGGQLSLICLRSVLTNSSVRLNE
jgi:hypothetical protein